MIRKDLQIILGSKSPRRRELLTNMGVTFEVRSIDVEEVYPSNLNPHHVAEYLAELKASVFENLMPNEVVITADTTVILDQEVLGKPCDEEEAVLMLKSMSGRAHDVVSGVCVKTKNTQQTFSVTTTVFFKSLSTEEITHYVTSYKPYDKAGAYGIQEWIGQIGIERVEGSFYNVVGLPTHELYLKLKAL